MAIPKSSLRGFTLIELLVVIAVISLLSSVVLASLNSARAKARDARRVADFRSMSTALELYFDKYGKYPESQNLCCTANDGGTHNLNFEGVAATLVAEKFLSVVPKAPIAGNPYMLYDYGAGNVIGEIFVTYLETVNPTAVGPFNSCRPFVDNWCSGVNPNTSLCICHPY